MARRGRISTQKIFSIRNSGDKQGTGRLGSGFWPEPDNPAPSSPSLPNELDLHPQLLGVIQSLNRRLDLVIAVFDHAGEALPLGSQRQIQFIAVLEAQQIRIEGVIRSDER
jgi:hypothetical protein